MIHYTLLPEKETKSLRTEYRIRVLVVLLFFISTGMAIGICSLVPSYIISYSQEKDALLKNQSIEKSPAEKQHEVFSTELTASSEILKKIKSEQNPVVFSDLIKKIVNYRNKNITINSIQLSNTKDASSTMEMILQGKATTRDVLINFKKTLEKDTSITKVELPVSDLAKNKDIEFALRIKIK